MSAWRTGRRIAAWTGIGLLGALILLTSYWVLPVLQDPTPGILPRKGQLSEAHLTRSWEQNGVLYQELTLVSTSGLEVEISVRRPQQSSGSLPVVVLLGGYRTGRDASALLPEHTPVMLAALSYPYAGDKNLSGLTLWRNLPAVQQALRDITPAIMLSLDYLLAQPHADTRQVELVGVSLGAFLVPIAGAVDTRIGRVWLVQGAADPRAIYAQRLRDKLDWAWASERLADVLALLTDVRHLSPERWVGQIAPRPVIVINSRHDPAFPPQSVQALHTALREPYEIIWLEEGGHVRPDQTAIIRQLSEIVLQRITSGALP